MVIVIVERDRDRDREGYRDSDDDDDLTHCHNVINFFGIKNCSALYYFFGLFCLKKEPKI